MTHLESTILAQAKGLAEPTHEGEGDVDVPLEQRLAIAVLQARAQECRHIAGQLDISGATLKFPILMAWRNGLRQRSSELERLGMEWAAGVWPPVERERESMERLVEVASQ